MESNLARYDFVKYLAKWLIQICPLLMSMLFLDSISLVVMICKRSWQGQQGAEFSFQHCFALKAAKVT